MQSNGSSAVGQPGLAAQLRSHPYAAAGLGLAMLTVLALIVAGRSLGAGVSPEIVRNALLGGLAGFAATAFGACGALVLRGLSARAEDSLLGFAAGMMLAASAFSLILPGIEAARDQFGPGAIAGLVVALGLGLGVALMLGLDRFTPHEHAHIGVHGPQASRVPGVWLFVIAITLHNLPEGMAIGVAFSQGDLSVGLPLTAAIAIQDAPEGLAVAMALRAARIGPWRAVLVAAASGLMEPIGALIGLGLSTGMAIAYPIGLGLAAGAMIFVVSHEVIPETHRNGHQTPATIGLMGGFAVMMVLDTAFG
ncbi:MAG: ZIP family metal transporter [Burkholderiaceae bacterium]|jgi:ZIP family zinc transporter|nr:ZIP family metal transporter [Burkholderiaceae bacterium]MEB2318333.1 ZIP family metal transporter [Pseudomonadota bacterium]